MDVLQYSTGDKTKRLHPTQKPVDLLEYLVKTYTNPGETVLDNCMGAVSTGVACLNTGREFVGIELDPEYYQIAKERIEQHVENIFEYMDKSKITLTGKGSDISLRLAMKYNNLYNREAVRAEYQRYPKNKYAAIPLEAKIKQLKETEE